jgi:hypothetical protein
MSSDTPWGGGRGEGGEKGLGGGGGAAAGRGGRTQVSALASGKLRTPHRHMRAKGAKPSGAHVVTIR